MYACVRLLLCSAVHGLHQGHADPNKTPVSRAVLSSRDLPPVEDTSVPPYYPGPPLRPFTIGYSPREYIRASWNHRRCSNHNAHCISIDIHISHSHRTAS